MKYGLLCLLLTGLPAIAADGPNPVSVLRTDTVLPQVADGGGWTTRITLVNMDIVEAFYRLWFRDDAGKPWPISLNGDPAAASWSGRIPIGGSVVLESPGTAKDVVQGWVYLETNERVSGLGFFKHDIVTNDPQAVVPFANQFDRSFYLPFDNRRGSVTALALVNPDQTENANITLTFRNPDGSSILLDRLTLNPLQHIAFSILDKYAATAQKTGVIEFSVNGRGAAGMGLLFTDKGNFTSVHALSK